jgi:hypothetical protein
VIPYQQSKALHTPLKSDWIFHTIVMMPRKEFLASIQNRTQVRDSSVGIAIGYGLEGRQVGARIPVRSRFFLLSTSCRPVMGPTQSPVQGLQGTLSPGVKPLGSEAGHSPPTSAKVKKMRIYIYIYIYTPPYVFMA